MLLRQHVATIYSVISASRIHATAPCAIWELWDLSSQIFPFADWLWNCRPNVPIQVVRRKKNAVILKDISKYASSLFSNVQIITTSVAWYYAKTWTGIKLTSACSGKSLVYLIVVWVSCSILWMGTSPMIVSNSNLIVEMLAEESFKEVRWRSTYELIVSSKWLTAHIKAKVSLKTAAMQFFAGANSNSTDAVVFIEGLCALTTSVLRSSCTRIWRPTMNDACSKSSSVTTSVGPRYCAKTCSSTEMSANFNLFVAPIMTWAARLKFWEKTTGSISSTRILATQSSLSKVRRRKTKKWKTYRLKYRAWEKIMTVKCNGCMSRCKWWRQRCKNSLRKATPLATQIHWITRIAASATTTTASSRSKGDRRLLKRSQSRRPTTPRHFLWSTERSAKLLNLTNRRCRSASSAKNRSRCTAPRCQQDRMSLKKNQLLVMTTSNNSHK